MQASTLYPFKPVMTMRAPSGAALPSRRCALLLRAPSGIYALTGHGLCSSGSGIDSAWQEVAGMSEVRHACSCHHLAHPPMCCAALCCTLPFCVAQFQRIEFTSLADQRPDHQLACCECGGAVLPRCLGLIWRARGSPGPTAAEATAAPAAPDTLAGSMSMPASGAPTPRSASALVAIDAPAAADVARSAAGTPVTASAAAAVPAPPAVLGQPIPSRSLPPRPPVDGVMESCLMRDELSKCIVGMADATQLRCVLPTRPRAGTPPSSAVGGDIVSGAMLVYGPAFVCGGFYIDAVSWWQSPAPGGQGARGCRRARLVCARCAGRWSRGACVACPYDAARGQFSASSATRAQWPFRRDYWAAHTARQAVQQRLMRLVRRPQLSVQAPGTPAPITGASTAAAPDTAAGGVGAGLASASSARSGRGTKRARSGAAQGVAWLEGETVHPVSVRRAHSAAAQVATPASTRKRRPGWGAGEEEEGEPEVCVRRSVEGRAVYQGTLKVRRRWGRGAAAAYALAHTGGVQKGLRDGWGVYAEVDGMTYEGTWARGRPTGCALLCSATVLA